MEENEDIFQPRRLKGRNKLLAKEINLILKQGGLCFDGKMKSVDTMDHQHLCNTYWFNKIFNDFDEEDCKLILQKIEERFNNVLLPYKPMFEFKYEFVGLFTKGLVRINEAVLEIWFEGKKIGQY